MKFDNFIKAYQFFADGNEAPPLFHLWGALATLSAIASRRIWFDQSYYQIYPNMYIVFVGEPGDKKSTALSIARRFTQISKAPVAPPSITKEAMTKLLNSKNEDSPYLSKISKITDKGEFIEPIAQMAIFASEIVTMLSAGGNPIGIIEFLTDIFDRDVFEVVTKNQGTDVIINPFISMLACMTPEQTGQMLKQSIITGGFSRRCVFVAGKSKAEGIPFPKLTEEQKEAETFLIEGIDRVKKIKGVFTMSPEARSYFEEWYKEKHRQLQQPGSAVTKNWLRSKDTQAIKVAMLLTVSAFDETRVITKETLLQAIKMLDQIEPSLNKVFSGAGRNIASELAEKIKARIEEAPKKQIPKKKLLTLMFSEGTYAELTEAFNFLIETNQVRKIHPPGKQHVEILTTQMEGTPET